MIETIAIWAFCYVSTTEQAVCRYKTTQTQCELLRAFYLTPKSGGNVQRISECFAITLLPPHQEKDDP